MSEGCTIRPATPADAGAMLVVHVAAIFEHGPEADTDRQVAAWAARPEGTGWYLDAMDVSGTEVVVAQTTDETTDGVGLARNGAVTPPRVAFTSL